MRYALDGSELTLLAIQVLTKGFVGTDVINTPFNQMWMTIQP